MRIGVLGAGSIGCYFAAKLAAAKADVRVIARGPTLDAINAHGITIEGHETFTVSVQAASVHASEPVDVLVSCVKAYALSALAADIARLVKPNGLWVCTVNGLPWWYGTTPLESVDPGQRISNAFVAERTAGCVAYLRCEQLRPGVVSFTGGRGLIAGMARDKPHPLLQACAELFTAAGIRATETTDIRSAVWNKLFGNVALNPLSALTGCTTDDALADPELRGLLAELIGEAMKVARAEGIIIESEAAARVRAMAPLGAFRTSMLQDVDAGRPIELDAILGAMIEVADRVGVAVPASRRLYALVRAFAQNKGLMPK